MPRNTDMNKEQETMFNEIEVEDSNQQQKNNQRRNNSYFFGESRLDNIPLNENTNNQDRNYFQNYIHNQEVDYPQFSRGSFEQNDIHSSGIHSKARARTSPRQLEVLENVCRTTLKPSKDIRVRLASELCMTERQVQIWFQNKRAKTKKFAEKPNIRNSEYGMNYSVYHSTPYITRSTGQYPKNGKDAYSKQEVQYTTKPSDFYYNLAVTDPSRYSGGYCSSNPYGASYGRKLGNDQSNFYDYGNVNPNYVTNPEYLPTSEAAPSYQNNEGYDDNATYYYDNLEDNFKNQKNK